MVKLIGFHLEGGCICGNWGDFSSEISLWLSRQGYLSYIQWRDILDSWYYSVYRGNYERFLYLYDEKGKPFSSAIKGPIEKALKDIITDKKLRNDVLSKAINFIKGLYLPNEEFEAYLYTGEEALFEIGKNGDSCSCFRNGKTNSSHPYWLLNNLCELNAYMVVIIRKDDGGRARFWLVEDPEYGIYEGFNFYGKGLDLLSPSYRYLAPRAIRLLFEEEDKDFMFVWTNDEVYDLPIYINTPSSRNENDRILICYDKNVFENSGDVFWYAKRIPRHAYCMHCYNLYEIPNLRSVEKEGYNDIHIGNIWWALNNPIVCMYCREDVERKVYYCSACEEEMDEDDVYWHDGEPYCSSCYEELFFYCDRCGCSDYRENAVYCWDIDEDVCDDCFDRNGQGTCDKCGHHFYKEPLHTVYKYRYDTCSLTLTYEEWLLCDECLEDYDYRVCDNCSSIIVIPPEWRKDTIRCPYCKDEVTTYKKEDCNG